MGDWNGFDVKNAAAPWSLVRKTAPNPSGTPDNFTWFTSTLHVAATGGDTTPGTHTFVLVSDKTWAEQWGGITVEIDAINSTGFYPGTALGPTNSITLSEGYYSCHVLDPLTDDAGPPTLNLSVFKTSAPPVELFWSGQTPAAPTAADSTVVSFTTNLSPSPEEKLYLRWTTDTFTDSTLVPAVGSETTYSATIPPQPANTLVQYTILSSTVDLTPYTKSGTIDALTLANTISFRYVTASAPTPPTTPPHQPRLPRQHPHLLLRQRQLLPQHLRRHQLRPPCLLQLQLNQSTNQSQSEKPQNSVFAPLVMLSELSMVQERSQYCRRDQFLLHDSPRHCAG